MQMERNALRNPQYRLYFIGNVFSMNAIWMQRIIVGWIGWQETGSAAFVGVLGFLLFFPTFFVSPLIPTTPQPRLQ
ncbi:MAG TPA: hypothetical protein VLA51_11880, partial [Paracoccaceae bacterium]|nr:hypothetical protein [Paracoccaceae bacterium]